MGTGRIADHQTGGQMNDRRPVFYHFFSCILDVTPGAPVASGKTNQFNLVVYIPAESPFPILHRSQTLNFLWLEVAATKGKTC